ncbi:hypothetical protein AcW1_001810 [Taiwanofungus camphoratus]|nr:hypothetical protein AcW1_001810 [Antrodia cinnamomea]
MASNRKDFSTTRPFAFVKALDESRHVETLLQAPGGLATPEVEPEVHTVTLIDQEARHTSQTLLPNNTSVSNDATRHVK